MDEASTSNLFSDVKFVIAECHDVDSTKNLLIDNGAKHINYLSEHVTLVISDVACLEADEALNIFEKPIVSSLWVHLSLKANRLLPPEAFCPYKNIFQDVVASFSPELTRKDTNVLACTLTYYGARLSKNVATSTHFIVPKSDAKNQPSENPDIKIVAPDWVLESVKLNTCCNEELFEPSLLLPPPPPRPPTPPPVIPQDPEPSKLNVPSDQVSEINRPNQSNQACAENAGNPQQYQPQARVRQPYPASAQGNNSRPPLQNQPTQQLHLSSPDLIRQEPQPQSITQNSSQSPQTRPTVGLQRVPHPQMQSQMTSRFQSHPQARTQSPHTQQHPHHQAQQHTHPLQHQHYQQHSNQLQQHHSGHPNQPMKAQSQPVTHHRMIRPQAIHNHQVDQKQNNMRPIHPSQMTNMRHPQPDQITYDNFNQPNHRRPDYVGTPPQYQPQSHPRVRQPYSPMPPQAQVHQIQTPMRHASALHQHQHVSPERIQPELHPPSNIQQNPQLLPRSGVQHHPQGQTQPQMSPIIRHQHQSPQNQHHQQHQHQNQHHHGHPVQATIQMRPQSQPGLTHQVIRTQSHGPSHPIEQKQNSMQPLHSPQMTNMRHPPPEQISYDSYNQPKFVCDSPQYQPNPRAQQPYHHPHAPQQAQGHRIQSPLNHQPMTQQQHLVSPDRIPPEVQPHHTLQQQPQHMISNQQHHTQQSLPAQNAVQIRPQSSQVVRPQSITPSNQIDSRQNVVRPMHSPQVTNIQMNSPRLVPPEESVQPQPHPSIFDHNHESNLAQIKSKVPIVDESVQYFGHDPRQTVPKNQPLFGCRLKIVGYSEIEKDVKESWSRAVSEAGGIHCNDLSQATHLVCETRKSEEYLQAIKLGIRCVTIYWVNDIIALNRLTHPWKSLHLPLFYGTDDKPLAEEIITVTNFRGKERREVIEMISKTGAKYTDYFSSKNTLMICGKVGGDKYDRAVEWKIPLGNCQLLSDILLFGVQDLGKLLAQSKYQNFNRSDPLRIAFHPKIREFLHPWTKPIPLAEPQPLLDQPLLNGTTKESDITAVVEREKAKSNIADEEPKIVINGTDSDMMVKLENDQSSDNSRGNQAQPAPDNDEINERTPIIDSSDMTLEFKRPHNLPDTSDQILDEKENNTSPPKRIRKSQEPIRLLYTNVGSNMAAQIKEAATKFGLSFAPSTKDCTHLLVGQLCRTSKFICAFSHASYILSPSWLLESSAIGEILDEKPFIVKDREGEERYSFNLVHSLVKRKRRSELLFYNWVFFVTPSVRKNVIDIERIIESAGGCVCTKKAPSKKQFEQLKSEGKRVVVITCDDDYYLCSNLESYGLEVVSPEFVISGILRQDIDFEVHRVRKKPRLEYT